MRLLALDTRNSNKMRRSSNETSDSGGQGTDGQALGSASSDDSKNSGRSGEARVIRYKPYATSKQNGDVALPAWHLFFVKYKHISNIFCNTSGLSVPREQYSCVMPQFCLDSDLIIRSALYCTANNEGRITERQQINCISAEYFRVYGQGTSHDHLCSEFLEQVNWDTLLGSRS